MAFYKPNPYVHADYNLWERKRTSSLDFQSTLHHLSSLCVARKSQQQYTSRPHLPQHALAEPRAESHIRQHQHHHHHHHAAMGLNRLVARPIPVLETPTQQLLKAMIVRKKETLEKLHTHLVQLQEKNIQLVVAIQSTDETTHENVSHSLDKYHKFKGVISKVKQRGATELKEAKEDLIRVKSETESILTKMRAQLHEEELMLDKCSQQLHTLVNYKEKDYPLKQVKIEQLQMSLEYLDELHEKEESELEENLQEERSKFDRKMDEIRHQLETKASENWLTQMKRSVFARAIHNKVMEKEMDLQRNNEQELVNDINTLKTQIQRMVYESGKNSILMTPLLKLGRCSSQTEIHLEIPTNHELPV